MSHVPFSANSTALPKKARQSFTNTQQSRVSAHKAVPPMVLPFTHNARKERKKVMKSEEIKLK